MLTEEKVDRINRQVSRLSNLLQRPALANQAVENTADGETHAAFLDYIRGGDTRALRKLETHSFTAGTSRAGAELIPHNIYLQIASKTTQNSVIRQLANVQNVNTGNALNYVRASGNFTATWANSETTRRTNATNTSAFYNKKIEFFELYANPGASSEFLEDTGVDVESWLVDEIARTFSMAEDQAYILGNGSSQPLGIAASSTTTSKTETDHNVRKFFTGVRNDLPEDAVDFLITFYTTLSNRFRRNGAWLMNASTIESIRKLKDANDNYIWWPKISDGYSTSLFGYPIYEEANMPDLSVNNKPSILFGDIRSAYVIVERRDIDVLRDPYTQRPLTTFYVTKRVGGGLVDARALLYVIATTS